MIYVNVCIKIGHDIDAPEILRFPNEIKTGTLPCEIISCISLCKIKMSYYLKQRCKIYVINTCSITRAVLIAL